MESARVRPRGRPRPKATQERDEKVLAKLQKSGPLTRNDLANVLGEEQSLVSLSIVRLRRAELVRKCSGEGAYTLWAAVANGPCPDRT